MTTNQRKRKMSQQNSEAEDWCFACKDGGDLILCDHEACPKVYHLECVEKDASALKNGKRWTCDQHSCFVCHKTPKYYCFVCPNSVCETCRIVAEFAVVRGKKGFCPECLKLVLLAEENLEYDSDGEDVDFRDRDSYECLFKEYWDIIKEEEGLTLDDAYAADLQIKKGCYVNQDDHKVSKKVSSPILLDSDHENDSEEENWSTLSKNRAKNTIDVIDWRSKTLPGFLTSIGIDTTEQLSQDDIELIILKYIHERKLSHPYKKRMVVCDEKLRSLFRKRTVSRQKIYNLLGAHFAENAEEYDSDDGFDDEKEQVKGDHVSGGSSSTTKSSSFACKKQKTSANEIKVKEEVNIVKFEKSCFASIVKDNIKLVYLSRSLVEKLLKSPESFEEKVVGCFVKVKTDPLDCSNHRRNSHQLLPVKDVKRSSSDEANGQVLVQICDHIASEIPISKLSDSDITEEECEDLREKVKNGLLLRPSVVEMEQKARVLHEDIMKHWIEKELASLQHRIDSANEKGRRRELFEFWERREELKKPSVQERLLGQLPTILPELMETKLSPDTSSH